MTTATTGLGEPVEVDTSLVEDQMNSGSFTGNPGIATPTFNDFSSLAPTADDEFGGLLFPVVDREVFRKTVGADTGWGSASATGRRAAVVAMARRYTGVPYVWGGSSTRGWDCSGFVQYVLQHNGFRGVPRVSFQQANWGSRVSRSAARPGDLVAWNNSVRNNGADHIAIYLGNGMIAEAPRTGVPTRIRRLGRREGAWFVKLRYPGD